MSTLIHLKSRQPNPFTYNEMIGHVIYSYIMIHAKDLKNKVIEIAEFDNGKKMFIAINDYHMTINMFIANKHTDKVSKESIWLNTMTSCAEKINTFIRNNSEIFNTHQLYFKIC